MRILAVETSCDETGVAALRGTSCDGVFSLAVLASRLYSQASLHAPFGGVYPTLAKREHAANLPSLLEETLSEARLRGRDFDAVAVTEGPGLEPALWAGITFAQGKAREWGLPLFGVNHLEGHLISSLAQMEKPDMSGARLWKLADIAFPVLGLLISGGHTEFVVMNSWFKYKRIGKTRDDAVGEAFDKVARMLSLPYPGGPHISRLAQAARKANTASFAALPRPMIGSGNCDVSFSGLKTAALYALRGAGGAERLSEGEKAAFAREFEDSVGDVLEAKTHRALKESGAATFVIGGGVAANGYLRARLLKLLRNGFPSVEARLPQLSITGDNAIMIGQAALTHLLSGDWKLSEPPQEVHATGNLSIEASETATRPAAAA